LKHLARSASLSFFIRATASTMFAIAVGPSARASAGAGACAAGGRDASAGAGAGAVDGRDKMLRSLQPALAERAREEVQAPWTACTDSAPSSCGAASRRTPTRLAASAPQHGAWQEPLPLPPQAHSQCSDLVRASCWFARLYVVSSLDDV
jgi:hypothetical protein